MSNGTKATKPKTRCKREGRYDDNKIKATVDII